MTAIVAHLRHILDRELSGADLDALDDAELRKLHNALEHWRELAELRLMERRRRQRIGGAS